MSCRERVVVKVGGDDGEERERNEKKSEGSDFLLFVKWRRISN